MDLQKASVLLEKINGLFRNLNADSAHISAIEKDLMRTYLRELYEVFVGEQAAAPQPFKQPQPQQPQIVIRETPSTPVEEVKPRPRVQTSPPPPPPPPPVVQDVPAKPAPKRTLVQDDPEEEDMAAASGPSPIGNEDLDQLFDQPQAKELSDRLSELPIPDLNKAMGLNERIFTINELFDGDQEIFKKTMLQLNGLSNFEEAKNYLVKNIAVKFNWAAREKKNKAKNFIKLVRRRYN